jgi:hypothetical protein
MKNITMVESPNYSIIGSTKINLDKGPLFEDLMTQKFRPTYRKGYRWIHPKGFPYRSRNKLFITYISNEKLIITHRHNFTNIIYILNRGGIDNVIMKEGILKEYGVSTINEELALLYLYSQNKVGVLNLLTGEIILLQFFKQPFRDYLISNKYIFIGLRNFDQPGELYCLDPKGNFLWGYIFLDILQVPIAGRINYQPYHIYITEKYIIVRYFGLVYHFNFNGELLYRINIKSKLPKPEKATNFANLILGFHKDHIAIDALIILEDKNRIYILECPDKIFVFNLNWDYLWTFEIENSSYLTRWDENSLLLIKINGDGYYLDLDGKVIGTQNFPRGTRSIRKIPNSECYILDVYSVRGYDSYYLDEEKIIKPLFIGGSKPYLFDGRLLLLNDNYIWATNPNESWKP